MPGPNDENGRPVSSDDLQRAHDAARVAGLDARGRDRDRRRCELGVRARQAVGGRDLGLELGADRAVLGRERQRVDDGLHVQAGAADEQRPLAARLDVGDRGARRVLEARDRPLVGRVGDVDQVVRDRGLLARRVGLAVPMSRPR